MPDSTMKKSYFFAASSETVWSFLTEKDKLAQWFHPATANLVEGEEYTLVKREEDGSEIKQCWGTVLEMKRPSLLVYSFTVEPFNGAMTTVTWSLEEIHEGTRLTLTHEGISEAAGESAIRLLLALDEGWDKHVDRLRNVVNPDYFTSCHE